MQEIFEFRLYERLAKQFLPDDVGKKAGALARVVRVSKDMDLFSRIAASVAKAKEEGRDDPIASWSIRRHYSEKELMSAEIVHLCVDQLIEVDSEGSGTRYDYSQACQICGAGRRPIGSLSLPKVLLRNLKGIATTFSKDEILISGLHAKRFGDARIVGAEYEDIHLSDNFDDQLPGALQAKRLIVTSSPISVAAPSRFGIDPFDYDDAGSFRCPFGHVAGLNLLSELHVSLDGWDGSDWFQTEQSVGIRRGALVPAPLLLISQKLYRLIREYPMPGCHFEVVRTVELKTAELDSGN